MVAVVLGRPRAALAVRVVMIVPGELSWCRPNVTQHLMALATATLSLDTSCDVARRALALVRLEVEVGVRARYTRLYFAPSLET